MGGGPRHGSGLWRQEEGNEKERRWESEMTGRREGCGPHEGRRQTGVGNKQRKMIEEGPAFGE